VNTRERLRVLYGDDQSVDIDSPASGGCVVTLRLPYHTRSRS
jgi:sensor histidine kinase YesM